MKQVVSLILSLFILISSVSGAVNIHYCAGQFASVSILPGNSTCCCGKAALDDCCDDELLIIESDHQEQVFQNIEVEKDIAFANILRHEEFVEVDFVDADFYRWEEYRPPPSQRPLWLLNCSFVYYG